MTKKPDRKIRRVNQTDYPQSPMGPARVIEVLGDDGAPVYTYSMAGFPRARIGKVLTEADWKTGEREALVLAKGRNDDEAAT
jgi:hypothetical protein